MCLYEYERDHYLSLYFLDFVQVVAAIVVVLASTPGTSGKLYIATCVIDNVCSP